MGGLIVYNYILLFEIAVFILFFIHVNYLENYKFYSKFLTIFLFIILFIFIGDILYFWISISIFDSDKITSSRIGLLYMIYLLYSFIFILSFSILFWKNRKISILFHIMFYFILFYFWSLPVITGLGILYNVNLNLKFLFLIYFKKYYVKLLDLM